MLVARTSIDRQRRIAVGNHQTWQPEK